MQCFGNFILQNEIGTTIFDIVRSCAHTHRIYTLSIKRVKNFHMQLSIS